MAVGCFTACEDDKDTFTVQTPAASTVEQSVSTLVINDANLNEIVYTLNFSASDGDLKNDAGAKLGSGTYIVECSLNPDFTGAVKSEVVTVESGNNSKSYTGTDLNTLATSLGAEAEKATTVYFRVIHTYNEKTAALGTPSNVVELNLTPCKVVPTLNVLSKDGSEVVAKLQLNSATNLYEGEYTYKEWNFYFADALDGTVYGCDDAYTKPDDGVNRSCNIVKGRAIGDDYSMWFDPSIRPVTMKVDLENMTWTYERIATEKKDLTGAIALLVGANMGWNDGWVPSEEIPGVEFVKNGDVYTAVFEGVVMTAGSAFGFRATQPAATWIGKGATVSAPLSDEGNDLTNTETGIFTVTLKAVCTDDGSVTYSISAEKTGVAEKKDLTGVAIIVVGEDMGWHDSWTPEEGVVVTANGDEYTAVFEGVALTGQFGFRATAPASTWIGGTTFATISDNLEIDGNLKAKEGGLYKLTVKAVANIDGSVTYTLEAEKTGNLAVADYTGKTEGIKGSFNEWTAVGAVAPTVDGNKYTWTISGIAMAEGDEFGFTGEAADWLGKGGLTVASECISEEKGNLSVTAAGTYTFVLVATANDNGTTSWSVSASASSK